MCYNLPSDYLRRLVLVVLVYINNRELQHVFLRNLFVFREIASSRELTYCVCALVIALVIGGGIQLVCVELAGI